MILLIVSVVELHNNWK